MCGRRATSLTAGFFGGSRHGAKPFFMPGSTTLCLTSQRWSRQIPSSSPASLLCCAVPVASASGSRFAVRTPSTNGWRFAVSRSSSSLHRARQTTGETVVTGRLAITSCDRSSSPTHTCLFLGNSVERRGQPVVRRSSRALAKSIHFPCASDNALAHVSMTEAEFRP